MKTVWMLCESTDLKTLAYISLDRIIKTAEKNNLKLDFIEARKLQVAVSNQDHSIILDGAIKQPPDAVFNCLTTNKANLEILSVFDLFGVPVIPTLKGMVLANNKWLTSLTLIKSDVPIPRTTLLSLQQDNAFDLDKMTFPVILKRCYGAFGDGVYLARDKDELNNLLRLAIQESVEYVILQEYINYAAGCDIRVLVFNNKAKIAVRRKAKQHEFRANTSLGGECAKITMTSELENLSTKAVNALGLCYGGVDLLECETGYSVIEVNSRPFFNNTEVAYQADILDLLVKHIFSRAN